LGFSLPAVFIASWQRSLSVPKPAKQNVVKFGDHGVTTFQTRDINPTGYSQVLGESYPQPWREQ
jgi:hypothetical protein